MANLPSWVTQEVNAPEEYEDLHDWFHNSGEITSEDRADYTTQRERWAVSDSGEGVGRIRTSVGKFTQGVTSGVVGFGQVVTAGWQQLFEVGADLAYGNPIGRS